MLLPPGSVERINTMTEQTARLSAAEARINELQQERAKLRQDLAIIFLGSSEIERALRSMARFARRLVRYARRILASVRQLYRRGPLSATTKMRAKRVLFTRAPFLFRSTASYRAWLETRDAPTAASQQTGSSRVD